MIKFGGYFSNVAAAGGVFLASLTLTIAFYFSIKQWTKIKLLLGTAIILQLFAFLLTNSRAAIFGFYCQYDIFDVQPEKKVSNAWIWFITAFFFLNYFFLGWLR